METVLLIAAILCIIGLGFAFYVFATGLADDEYPPC